MEKIKQFTYFSQSKIYKHLKVLKTFSERDVPDDYGGKTIALR